jgi:hypothetical protein
MSIGSIPSYYENHYTVNNSPNGMKKLTNIVVFGVVINKCRLVGYFLPLTHVFIMIFLWYCDGRYKSDCD